MKATMNTPKFDEYFESNKELLGRIDEAAERCVKAGQGIQYREMKRGLERHKDQGDALKSLEKDPIIISGNNIYTKTGTRFEKNEQGFLHGYYQEFGVGSNKYGGKARFVKDPWFRPAVDGTKAEIRKEWRKIIKRMTGVDVK